MPSRYNGIGQPNVGLWDVMGEVDSELVSRVHAQQYNKRDAAIYVRGFVCYSLKILGGS